MKFLFPSDPMSPKRIDEFFLPQAEVLTTENRYALYAQENHKLYRLGVDEEVLYRGWMLAPEDYAALYELVQQLGSNMFTNPAEYIATHYLPSWYPLLAKFTPTTVVFFNRNLEEEGFDLVEHLRKMQQERGWSGFFFKDFVKSLKTSGGSVIFDPEEARELIEKMRHFRGTLEGGLVVRRYEKLRDERRYFVVNRRYRGVLPPSVADRELLDEVIKVVDSPFYSVDIADGVRNGEKVSRLVEIGDGQVSDLVGGWTPTLFSVMVNDLFNVLA